MNEVGLVFAGGGGKGSYQIGVWRAMKALHLDQTITCISGNSVGSLNAVLFAQGNLSLAEQAWFDMDPNDVLYLDLKRILLLRPSLITPGSFLRFCSTQGYFSRQGLVYLMNKYIDFSALRCDSVFCCCSDITNYPPSTRALLAIFSFLDEKPFGNATYFKLSHYDIETQQKILLASSAIPLVFKPEKIDKQLYYDGGLVDNVPIQPLITHHCSTIYIVYCDSDQQIDCSLYPDTQIIEITPSEDLGDLLNGTFDFSDAGVIKRMELGYRDAKKILD
jgi:NTE family protein